MTELLHNAWYGWQYFITDGKLAALLGASLIFLWLSYKRVSQKTLLIYTTVIAVCCVIPVTAAGLMLYQTKFYDYQWIWSLVPMTVVIAYGAVTLLTEYWHDLKLSEWKKGVPVLALFLALLALSGGPGKSAFDGGNSEQEVERAEAEAVLAQIQTEMKKRDICLWAPKEIMEYARETDAAIQLLYGRNMWDEWLDAYAYDTYSEETMALYLWMEEAAASGDAADIKSNVESALRAGADCILLPGELDERSVEGLETTLNVRSLSLEGYYLLVTRG